MNFASVSVMIAIKTRARAISFILKERKTHTRAYAVSVQKVLEFVAAGAVNAQKVLAWRVRRHVAVRG